MTIPLLHSPRVTVVVATLFTALGFPIVTAADQGASPPRLETGQQSAATAQIGNQVSAVTNPGVVISLVSDRDTFVRMEPARLQFSVSNGLATALSDAMLALETLGGGGRQTLPLPVVASGQTVRVEAAWDTTLRPGVYELVVQGLTPQSADGRRINVGETRCRLTLVPRPLPHRMPVVMWGIYGAQNVRKELPRLKDIGFTHCLGFSADMAAIWKAGQPTTPATAASLAANQQMLNQALAQDFRIVASLPPGRWVCEQHPERRRVDRQGQPYTNRVDVCGLSPGLSNFCFNVGASMGQAYAHFPAWDAALLHTEVRDAANLCFHEHDLAALRAATGLEMPTNLVSKSGIAYAKVKDFPANRVIPDDYPLLRVLQWYWREGDGWNGLNTALARGLHAGGARVWTFHDPAARVASVSGSGGAVDVLSQWTYSYPDPIRIGLATDELFAFARLADPVQGVMKMTQIIWYRSQTAPAGGGPAKTLATWEDTDPGAGFLTIAPHHLREAFWTKIARPVRGIMYHGWPSLVADVKHPSYRFTHPDTQHELRRLIKTVVEPLGPTLLQVPDRSAEVACLQSFAAEMFAGRGTYGWGRSWGADAYFVLLYAQLQPEIVFDETVVRQGLDRFRVVVLADCDVLTEQVVRAVRAFQQRGGLVIGDERLTPALQPDLVIPVYRRRGKAREDRAALLERAAELRTTLDRRYRRHADSSNPDVLVRCRQADRAEYVFAVNDRRTYGHYVGHYGLVMEDGLPADATLSLDRTSGFVYDLTRQRPVPTQVNAGRLTFTNHFEPCDGAVFLVTDTAIEKVRVESPARAVLGQTLPCDIVVADSHGQPVAAVVPVEVTIADPRGHPAEFSGSYGAKAGRLSLSLDLARNDTPGNWIIRVRELASGQSAERNLTVTSP